MPHIIIEYSSNLSDELDRQAFIKVMHESALATGVFPVGGARTRAARRDEYLIADGHPDNAFVHISVRIGHGRDAETKKRAAEQLMATAKNFLTPIFNRRPLGISLEMQELDAVLNFKHNNLHEYAAKRKKGGTA